MTLLFKANLLPTDLHIDLCSSLNINCSCSWLDQWETLRTDLRDFAARAEHRNELKDEMKKAQQFIQFQFFCLRLVCQIFDHLRRFLRQFSYGPGFPGSRHTWGSRNPAAVTSTTYSAPAKNSPSVKLNKCNVQSYWWFIWSKRDLILLLSSVGEWLSIFFKIELGTYKRLEKVNSFIFWKIRSLLSLSWYSPSQRGAIFFRNKTFSGIKGSKFKKKGTKLKKKGTKLNKKDQNSRKKVQNSQSSRLREGGPAVAPLAPPLVAAPEACVCHGYFSTW